MNIIEELKTRKILANATTSTEKIVKLKGKGVYIGFDPTAASLHLGNYIQIVNLLRFKNAGYKIYALIGGATAMIGDPSGKKVERTLLSNDVIKKNKINIKRQLENFGITVIDNYSFYENINILNFLRNIGKLLNVNYMINKDVVKSRLKTGISFTEFSYQLIQGWDFYWLFKKYNICIQIGGSDQWGNITSGLEIIRKIEGPNKDVAGITTKLLIKSNGDKFGKTNDVKNENIWLSKNLTSTFKIYQYLLNQPDYDVEQLLNWLTFIPKKKIDKIIKEHFESPHKKIAQLLLANEVTENIRGKKELKKAIESSRILFSKIESKNINDKALANIIDDVPTITCKSINILDALVQTNLSISKREGREFVKNNAISVNGIKINDIDFIIQPNEKNNKYYALIKCGKRKNSIVIFK